MSKATLHSDGGARGNPGPAGIGAVLRLGETEHLYKKFIGHATNNQAEYEALILGLSHAKEMGVTEVECYLDSVLVVKQMKREYRVKDKDLAILFVKVWNLMSAFKKVTFTHVRREQNKLADQLVNKVIDETLKK